MGGKPKYVRPQEPPTGRGKWNDTRKDAKGAKPKSKDVPDAAAAPLETGQFRWATYRFDHEHDGAWDWRLSAVEARLMFQFIEEYSKKTCTEIEAEQTGGHNRHKKHHAMDVDILCNEAQERLVKLFDDEEELPEKLFRFRLGGTMRLWGIRNHDRFEALWFDRNHAVYPMD